MINPVGIPVIDGDADALARHAESLVTIGGDFADTGERVHSTWQQLAPCYLAPEAGQLLAATGPVRQVSASVGEDIGAVGRILGRYATELRAIKQRLDALRTDATALVGAAGGEPTAEQADRSDALLSQVNVAVADFDDAQRRCANAVNARYGGGGYRADNGDGRLDPGEYGTTAAALDAAARDGGVPWGQQAQAAPQDDGGFWSDLGHGALDVIGLVPVVGEIADGANAAWYAAEGDYLNASLSAAAMVPFLGWAATGGKFAVKGYKAVHSVDGARTWLTGRPPMVPKGATQLPFTPNAKFPVGQRYEWTHAETGQRVRYHAHGPDPARSPGDNAGKGPIYRVRVGSHYLDGNGVRHTQNSVNPNSPAFNPQAANHTHIPYPSDLPSPGANQLRVVAPNPAALLGPEEGSGE
ncbi:MAG TPA: polymorphic toxin type 30 domain-containing protein [Pseudonocardia sp.]|nr:polymorphic toxin type 30 domain-containing protein [Pseudonocardia sp.]